MPNLTSQHLLELLFEQIFSNFGILDDIVRDFGPQIISLVWSRSMDKIEVTISLTSGYHSQLNGQAKRANQKVGTFLWSFCHDSQGIWAKFLPLDWLCQELTVPLSHKPETWHPPCPFWATSPFYTTHTEAPAVDDWFLCSEQVWRPIKGKRKSFGGPRGWQTDDGERHRCTNQVIGFGSSRLHKAQRK